MLWLRRFPARDQTGARMNATQLRYTDGPSVEAAIVLDASNASIWALVTDIQLPARFSSEFRGAEWLDGAERPALGARFVGRNEHPAVGRWETTSTVTSFEPGVVFGWAIGDPDAPSASWRFTLSPDGSAVRLAQWMQIGPGRSGLSPAIDAMPDKEAKIIGRRLEEHRRNMVANLEGIKAILTS
jgi:Polyketide cyclase / dehydrase and lipid transport